MDTRLPDASPSRMAPTHKLCQLEDMRLPESTGHRIARNSVAASCNPHLRYRSTSVASGSADDIACRSLKIFTYILTELACTVDSPNRCFRPSHFIPPNAFLQSFHACHVQPSPCTSRHVRVLLLVVRHHSRAQTWAYLYQNGPIWLKVLS